VTIIFFWTMASYRAYPRAVWHKHIKGSGSDLSFMSDDYHRVRNYVVMEIPRLGKPLPPQYISQALELPLGQTVSILG